MSCSLAVRSSARRPARRRLPRRTLAALALLLLAGPLAATTPLTLGMRLEGRLAAPTAVEILAFDGLQGERITVSAAALRSGLRPRLELWDRTTDQRIAQVEAAGRRATLKAFVLPTTGPYELRLLPLDGSTGRWVLKSRSRLDKSLLRPASEAGPGGPTRVVFDAHPGTGFGAVLRAAKGSAATPGTPTLTGPGGPVDLAPFLLTKGTRTIVTSLPLPHFGRYTLEVPHTGGDGELLVKVRLEPTKAPKEILVTDALAGALTLVPDVVFSDDGATAVIARVALGELPYKLAALRLLGAPAGAPLAEVAPLYDDGELGFHEDELGADRVHTARILVQPAAGEDGLRRYRVEVDLAGRRMARSADAELLVAPHVGDADLDGILAIQTGSRLLLDQARADGTVDAVLDDLEAGLAIDPLVAEVARTESGRGLWVRYACGLAGVLASWEDGVKGGGSVPRAAAAPGAPSSRPYDAWLPAAPPGSGPPAPPATLLAAAGVPGATAVGSNKVRALAARHFAWGDADDVPQMAARLLEGGCHDVTYTAYAAEDAGDVDDWKGLGAYGLVLVSSHAESSFATLSPGSRERYGWDDGAQLCVHANAAATPAAVRTHEADLLRGRLVLWYGSFAVTPGFVRHHAGRMAGSIVYMGTCRSTAGDSLSDAFLGLGAGAYLGYSDSVAVAFCAEQGPALVEALLAPGATLAGAYTHAVETDDDPAEFLLRGTGALFLDAGRLHDGGFETGNLSAAWTADGDARLISGLGEFGPVSGGRVALLATGLGPAVGSGSLRQTLCLPADATALRFHWNLLSAEWLWWCGSIFQDTFEVTLTDVADPGNTALLFRRTIDELCGQVQPTALLFDKTPGTPPFENGQEAGDVYATSWVAEQVEIPASLRGRQVQLAFRCSDVGDGEWDTAVLLDDVELLAGP